LERAFAQFAGGARRVIAGGDDPGAMRALRGLSTPLWRVGFGSDADVRVTEGARGPSGSHARVRLADGREIEILLRVPGRHNLRNAAAVLAVAAELNADLERCVAALGEFRGVGRRFEHVGDASGVTVMDDYAHHPTEVSATLEAARQAFPGRRVVAVFQPHLYSRTASHGAALGQALAAADLVIVAPVYGARERPVPGVTADIVARGAIGAGACTIAVRDRDALGARVAEVVGAGDVVFTMGAGDVTRVGPEVLGLLRTPGSASRE
jgi:UDP-N-acetylmuramate--alanine ligase